MFLTHKRGIVIALLAGIVAVVAHRGPTSDSSSPEVDGVQLDVDNTWLLDQSFLIFCMYSYPPCNSINYNINNTLYYALFRTIMEKKCLN